MKIRSQSGSTLLWAIGALVLLSVVGATIAKMSPSALQGKLEQEAGARAYYNANSGLNYILGAQQAAQAGGTTFANFIDSMGNGAIKTMNLSGTDSFSYQLSTLNSANTTYQITNLVGTVSNPSGGAAYAYQVYGGGKGKSGTKTYIPKPESGGVGSKKISGKSLKVAGYVGGDVISDKITIQSGSEITGSVTNTDAGAVLSINGGVKVGSGACSADGIVIDGGSTLVSGDVIAQGDVTISGGTTINGNIYSGGNVTLKGGSTIKGNVYSMGKVDFLNAKMGAIDTRRYIYAGDTVTVTGGGTIYVDIHSQKNIALDNIVIYGDMYSNDGTTEVLYSTYLHGSKYGDPIAPTAPAACDTLPSYAITPPCSMVASETISGNRLFTAGDYCFKSLTINWGAKICLDVTGGDVNIFVKQNVTSNATIYVKDSSGNRCYDDALDGIDETYADSAAKVFFYTKGAFSMGGGTKWFGTVVAEGDIQPGGGSDIIGSLHSVNGTVNPGQSWYDIKLVGSDYLDKHP